MMTSHAQSACERDECNHYSDFDVYYDNGTSESLCSEHSYSGNVRNITHVIPQHGGDDVNQVIPTYEYRLVIQGTEMSLDVDDVRVPSYYPALRLRKLLGTSDHVQTATVQRRIIGEWEDI